MPVADILILSLEADACALARVGGRSPAQPVELDREPVGTAPPTSAAASRPWNSALAVLGKRHRGRRVTLLLPPELLLVRHLRLPAAARVRAQVARFEAARVLPLPLGQVAWGYHQAPETDGTAEALLFAARLSAVEELCLAAESAGLRVVSAWPATLATLTGFHSLRQADASEPQLLVTPGARATEIIQLEGARSAVRVVLAAADPALAPTERAAAVAAEVARTLRSFQEAGFAAPRSEASLAGVPDSDLAAWDEAFRARLQVGVRCVDHGTLIRWRGAAELAAGDLKNRVELLPPLRRSQVAWRRRTPWLAAAAALSIAAWAPAIAHEKSSAANVRAEAERLAAALAPWRQREAVRAAQQARLEDLQRQLAHLEASAEDRVRWTRLLADLEQRLGRVGDAWLERLAPKRHGDGGERIEFSGWILDRANPGVRVSPVAEARARRLFELLRQSPFVAAVTDEQLSAAEPGLLRFSAELVLVPREPQR